VPPLIFSLAFALAGLAVIKVLPRAPGCSRAVALATVALALAGVTAFATCAGLAAYEAERLPLGDEFVGLIWLSYLGFGTVVGSVLVALASLVARSDRSRG